MGMALGKKEYPVWHVVAVVDSISLGWSNGCVLFLAVETP